MTEAITIRPAGTPRPSLGGGPAPAYRRGPTKSPERRPRELGLPHHGQAVANRQAGAIGAATKRASDPPDPSAASPPTQPIEPSGPSSAGPASQLVSRV